MSADSAPKVAVVVVRASSRLSESAPKFGVEWLYCTLLGESCQKMAVMEGLLMKWTNVMKGWQYRWCVLDDSAGLLSYYTVKFKF